MAFDCTSCSFRTWYCGRGFFRFGFRLREWSNEVAQIDSTQRFTTDEVTRTIRIVFERTRPAGLVFSFFQSSPSTTRSVSIFLVLNEEGLVTTFTDLCTFPSNSAFRFCTNQMFQSTPSSLIPSHVIGSNFAGSRMALYWSVNSTTAFRRRFIPLIREWSLLLLDSDLLDKNSSTQGRFDCDDRLLRFLLYRSYDWFGRGAWIFLKARLWWFCRSSLCQPQNTLIRWTYKFSSPQGSTSFASKAAKHFINEKNWLGGSMNYRHSMHHLPATTLNGRMIEEIIVLIPVNVEIDLN